MDKFGGEFEEDGEDFRYKHPTGIKAHIAVAEEDLSVDVKLGLMTRSFAPQMEAEINDQQQVPVIMLTHEVKEAKLNAAISQLQTLTTIDADIHRIRVETLATD